MYERTYERIHPMRVDCLLQGTAEDPDSPLSDLSMEGTQQAINRRRALRNPEYTMVFCGNTPACISTAALISGRLKKQVMPIRYLNLTGNATDSQSARLVAAVRSMEPWSVLEDERYRMFESRASGFLPFITGQVRKYLKDKEHAPERILCVGEPILINIAARDLFPFGSSILCDVLKPCTGYSIGFEVRDTGIMVSRSLDGIV
jgi:hypothetical protein